MVKRTEGAFIVFLIVICYTVPINLQPEKEIIEILFENSFVRNKEMAKEMYRYLYYRRPLYIICNTLMLLIF